MFKHFDMIILAIAWLLVIYFIVTKMKDLMKRVKVLEDFFEVVKGDLLTLDTKDPVVQKLPDYLSVDMCSFPILPQTEIEDITDDDSIKEIEVMMEIIQEEPVVVESLPVPEEIKIVEINNPKDEIKELKSELRKKGLSVRGCVSELKERLHKKSTEEIVSIGN